MLRAALIVLAVVSLYAADVSVRAQDVRDDSVAADVDAGDGLHVALRDLRVRTLELDAMVRSIRQPRPRGTGRAAHHEVVLDGPGPAEDRTVLLRIPRRSRLPFAVGDRLGVHVEARAVGAVEPAIEATLRDARGALLVGYSDSADPARFPGFTVRLVEPAEPSRGVHRALLCAHDGRTARLSRAGEIRRLVTPSGAFLLSGHARVFDERPRSPDGVDASVLAVLRMP